ncbi:hypothetical protein [Flavobacterium alkalisoli]|uniref:hypothetical protein n=1 Tax=Flavobacterium alkalisoli TaxID=2602769 RepID=UPI003A9349CC
MNFTATDITKIIKACGESGVYNFEFNGLKLQFDTKTNEQQSKLQAVDLSEDEVEALYLDSLNDEQVKEDQETENEDEEEVTEYDLNELMINDPVTYEQILMENS